METSGGFRVPSQQKTISRYPNKVDGDCPRTFNVWSYSRYDSLFHGGSTLNGEPLHRKHFEAVAKDSWLVPRGGVSRKSGMLVVVDPMHSPGRAKKARHLKVPVVSVNGFFELL